MKDMNVAEELAAECGLITLARDRTRSERREVGGTVRIDGQVFEVVNLSELFPAGRWQDEAEVKALNLGYGRNCLGMERTRHKVANFRAA